MRFVEKTAKVVDARKFDGTLESAIRLINFLNSKGVAAQYSPITFVGIRIRVWVVDHYEYMAEGWYAYFIEDGDSVVRIEDSESFENSWKDI